MSLREGVGYLGSIPYPLGVEATLAVSTHPTGMFSCWSCLNFDSDRHTKLVHHWQFLQKTTLFLDAPHIGCTTLNAITQRVPNSDWVRSPNWSSISNKINFSLVPQFLWFPSTLKSCPILMPLLGGGGKGGQGLSVLVPNQLSLVKPYTGLYTFYMTRKATCHALGSACVATRLCIASKETWLEST